MRKTQNCIVEGCPSQAHAKGYCRRHYGQIWRTGTIFNDAPTDISAADGEGGRKDDRIRALEREFKRAQQMYNVVVGFEGRMKWRREMEAVQNEIRKIIEYGESTDFADESLELETAGAGIGRVLETSVFMYKSV